MCDGDAMKAQKNSGASPPLQFTGSPLPMGPLRPGLDQGTIAGQHILTHTHAPIHKGKGKVNVDLYCASS